MASVPSDLYSIGWWIESTDERSTVRRPAATLVRFLSQGVISPNTLVRHCTEMTKRPVVDVPEWRGPARWPCSAAWRRLAGGLAATQERSIGPGAGHPPVRWKNRPAVLVCLHCGAPYCEKYGISRLNGSFIFARAVRPGLYNAERLLISSTRFCLTWFVGPASFSPSEHLEGLPVFGH